MSASYPPPACRYSYRLDPHCEADACLRIEWKQNPLHQCAYLIAKLNLTLTYTPALSLVAKNFTALIPVCDSRDPFAICHITEVDTTAKQTASLLASHCLETELHTPICAHEAVLHLTLPWCSYPPRQPGSALGTHPTLQAGTLLQSQQSDLCSQANTFPSEWGSCRWSPPPLPVTGSSFPLGNL